MLTRDIALALAIAVLWGVNFVVMKHAVSEVPPLLLTALRFALAALPAAFFVKRPAVSWRLLIAYGTAFGIVKFGLLFTALKLGSPSGLTSVLLQTQVFFTIAMAHVLLAENAGPRQQIGIAVALAGVAAIVSGAIEGAALLPTLLVVAAAVAWAVANLVLKRAGKIDMLAFTVWTSLIPPLPMLALSAAVEGTAAWANAWTHLTWLGATAVLYLAYPVSLAGGAAWGSLLARYPAAVVAPFALLVPIIGLACGALIYSEKPATLDFVGSAMILAGLALIVFSNRVPAGTAAAR